jgi:isopenicillin-N N-acyltransferase-like protein
LCWQPLGGESVNDHFHPSASASNHCRSILKIGLEHGTRAAPQIQSTIGFYTELFRKKCNLSWEQACAEAQKYAAHIHQHYPALETEMQGIAKGARVAYEEILALNVRSELFFGAALDGCTSLSWKTNESSFVAQNWDVSNGP